MSAFQVLHSDSVASFGDGSDSSFEQVFFYNPSTRTSVWERPPDLYNRPDVDLLVSKPPEEKKPDAAKETDDDRGSATSEGSDNDEENAPPAAKKSRKEKKLEKQRLEQLAAKKEKDRPRQMLEKQ
ncbi:unnamed protein product, partial [Gongylonema pulchrum]|uniref:WW domain-containing protein n=1 Tax=Gongylonema pulchrum TaxID=637853 RepID=A0A183D7H1_9BILA